MDDYAKEMMNLKTLVTRTLEKKGILARIRWFTPTGRTASLSQPSDRQLGSAVPANGKDEYNWRYDSGDLSEDIIRASTGLENIQLDKETRNLTTSWRHAGDGMMEGDGKVDHR